jgi:hypothetical protein
LSARTFDPLIAQARAVRIEDELGRRGIALRGRGADRCGPCPRCGGVDRFSINLRKQVFNCRGFGGGDMIALVQHIDSCRFNEAVAILTGDRGPMPTPTRMNAPREKICDERKQHRKAAWLWTLRKPIAERTPPWLYLRKRGYSMPIPATLGYLPARDAHPAVMIAAFGMAVEPEPVGMAVEPEPGMLVIPKPITGVHLTRLTAEGDKAPNAAGKTKVMLGVCKGAPVTISPPNNLCGMAVTEGIEDGLSVYQVTGLGVWVAGAAGFMPALAALVPGYIETVTIFGHADPAGRRAAIDLARALKARGIEVRVQGL